MKNKTLTYKPKTLWKFKKAYLDVIADELGKILKYNNLEDYKTGIRDTFYMAVHNYPGDVHIFEKDNPDNVIYSYGDNRIFTTEKYPLPNRDVLGDAINNCMSDLFGGGCQMGLKAIIKEYNRKKEIRISHLRKLDEVMNEIVDEINYQSVFKK